MLWKTRTQKGVTGKIEGRGNDKPLEEKINKRRKNYDEITVIFIIRVVPRTIFFVKSYSSINVTCY